MASRRGPLHGGPGRRLNMRVSRLGVAFTLSASSLLGGTLAHAMSHREEMHAQVALPAQQTPSTPTYAACPATLPAGMACIPGGAFVRGSDDDEANARPAESVRVSTFLIDTHEVNNAAWNACIREGACRRLVPFRGYLGEAQPAVGMRWDEAAAFCARRGARLPSEAEWEHAASGPNDTRYQWGNDPGDACANAVVRVRAGRGCGRETTWPVGSRSASPWGLFDMTGNVWEWTQDAYTECYRGCTHACGDACSGLDPRGPCGGAAECPESRGLRVVRGGAWWHEIDRAETHSRRGVPAANPNPHRFGFRCAADVPR